MLSKAKKKIVFVGGGHSHALVLKQWAASDDTEVVLVSPGTHTPYSGMLPGLVAGHYSKDEIFIDLVKLCQERNVRFINGTLVSIDLKAKTIALAEGQTMTFDVLSLDTGSVPEQDTLGVLEYSTPVKPISSFYQRWIKIKDNVSSIDGEYNLVVVGGGAAGYELATAIEFALGDKQCRVHWVVRSSLPLSSRPTSLRKKVLESARKRDVQVHVGFDVTEVSKNRLHAKDGRDLEADEVLWCAGAAAPSWPKSSGLQTDGRGFVAINVHLQSVSHPFVFASGDVGTLVESPTPKAGVFAVRHAPVLLENLQRFCRGSELKTFKPQKDFLTILAAGEKYAIANRGWLSVKGRWVWRWKNQIDKKFMNQFGAG